MRSRSILLTVAAVLRSSGPWASVAHPQDQRPRQRRDKTAGSATIGTADDGH